MEDEPVAGADQLTDLISDYFAKRLNLKSRLPKEKLTDVMSLHRPLESGFCLCANKDCAFGTERVSWSRDTDC